MTKKIKFLALLAAAVLSPAALSGCDKAETAGAADTVTIALWSDQLTERYAGYLQSRFPEVDFEFYVATNSADFYRFKQENGDLPDILTVRRFSLNDVSDWRGALMDLGGTDLANMYYQSYLRNYTYSDGTMNWLPACAEVDGLLVNKVVLEENGLEVPRDYEQFVGVCRALKDKGIRPFTSDFDRDYTCMEILQGLSASELTSQRGREWRQLYESGQTDRLDEEVWLPIFERMYDFIDYAGVSEGYLETSSEIFAAYKEHEVAMIRATASEARLNGIDGETVMLPFFGGAEEDNRYLTYPAFQVAASASNGEEPERRRLILDIMTAMLDEDGLLSIATGQNMISYTKDVELDFSSVLSEIPPYIDSNRLYIRLASSDMFSASEEIVRKMISGECPDARSAFDAFNAAMGKADSGDRIAAHIEKGYDYEFKRDGGNPAASAIMNTMREELGTQLLIGQSIDVAGDINAGDYTASELKFLVMGELLETLLCDMTGEQLKTYVGYLLSAEGIRGSVVNASTLYASSGFEMEIKETAGVFELEALTINGKALEDGAVYSVAVIGNERYAQKEALAAAGVTEYVLGEKTLKATVADRLANGGRLAEPTNYITLK